MIVNYFGHSGNDLKSGKLSAGISGRFEPEWVAGLGRNLHHYCKGLNANRIPLEYKMIRLVAGTGELR